MDARKGLVVASMAALTGAVASFGLVDRGAAAHAQPAAPAKSQDACASLARLKLDQVEIDLAQVQPAQLPVAGVRMPGMSGEPNGGPPVAGLPEFCRVTGHIRPEPGSDIRFEVWLPSQGWDGRLNGAGNGGFAGSIAYFDLAQAVKAGQVGASTDTGHSGAAMQSAWASGHPERVRDYGWRAIHLTAVTAKKLIVAFYGRAQDHTYFMSCSNGGRQALMEASRFPEDYDGVLAGAPASSATDLILSMINTVQAQAPAGAAIRPEQAKLLQDEVIRQCDALDGQTDGLIADPRRCRVDVAKLACGVNASPQCFTAPQLKALKKIYAGPHDASGRAAAPAYPAAGSEAGIPVLTGWDGWIFASPLRSHEVFSHGILDDLAPTPIATPQTFDYNRDRSRLKAALAGDLDAKPDLSSFFRRGGKLILYHGWADPAIPPQLTLQWRAAMLRASGPQAANSTQLFMVPGMQHCMGGEGPGVFGQLSVPQPTDAPDRSIAAALQAWVETGRKPESVVGLRGYAPMGLPSAGRVHSERLICAYPAQAVLRPGADPAKAESYSCRPAKVL